MFSYFRFDVGPGFWTKSFRLISQFTTYSDYKIYTHSEGAAIWGSSGIANQPRKIHCVWSRLNAGGICRLYLFKYNENCNVTINKASYRAIIINIFFQTGRTALDRHKVSLRQCHMVHSMKYHGHNVGRARKGINLSLAPRPDIKTKYEKYFFGDFLSADFWQKLWE